MRVLVKDLRAHVGEEVELLGFLTGGGIWEGSSSSSFGTEAGWCRW